MDDPTLAEWFCDNYTVINPDKYYSMCLRKNNDVEF